MGALLAPATLQAQSAADADGQDESDEEARHLFEAARRAFDDGRLEEALDLFQRSYERSERPQLLYNIGTTADRLRRNELALESFEAYLEAIPDAPERANIEARIRVIRQELSGEAGEDAEDVAEVPSEEAAGDLEPGGADLEEPTLEPRARRPFAWVAAGLALGSGIASAILWAQANANYDDLELECMARPCTEDDVSKVDRQVTLTNVFMGAGIGFGVAFAVLLFVEPKLWASDSGDGEVALGIGLGSLRLRGSF